MRMPLRLLLLTLAFMGCSSMPRIPAAGGPDLRPYFLPAPPSWARDPLSPEWIVDLEKVREGERLDALQALELQAYLQHGLENPQASIAEAFAAGAAKVRAGEALSGWKAGKPFERPGEFILALELEGVLAVGAEAAPRSADFVRRIRQHPLCRGVVLYSTLPEARISQFLARWPGKPWIDGVFSKHHLAVLPGGTRAVKDLSVLDAKLEHVVLVDVELERARPLSRLRLVPRWRPGEGQALDGLLAVVGEEISEAAAAAQQLGIPFSRAYAPYTVEGEALLRTVSRRMSRPEALRWIRARLP
jgi:hypothetical protein